MFYNTHVYILIWLYTGMFRGKQGRKAQKKGVNQVSIFVYKCMIHIKTGRIIQAGRKASAGMCL